MHIEHGHCMVVISAVITGVDPGFVEGGVLIFGMLWYNLTAAASRGWAREGDVPVPMRSAEASANVP